MCGEEHPGPRRVEGQLDEKQRQSDPTQSRLSSQPLHPPDGERHQHIDRRPNWREHPIRRIEGRFDQPGIPRRQIRKGGDLSNDRRGDNRNDRDGDKLCPPEQVLGREMKGRDQSIPADNFRSCAFR